MRIRTVKPEWLEDELLASASDEARVLSIALILMADDHGRGRASIATLAAGAWRYEMERDGGEKAAETLAKASRAIRELAAIGFVKVYDVARQRYYELPNWLKHQKVDKPGKPRVPAPEHEVSTSSRDTRETLAPDHDLGPRPKTNDHDLAGARACESAPRRDKSPDATRGERIRKGYLERFAKATPIKPPAQAQPGGGGPWLDLARDLTDEQCGPFLDAYFADDWCKGGGFKLGALASERVRLLTAGPTVAGQAAPVPVAARPTTPERAALSSALAALEAARGRPEEPEATERVMAARRAVARSEGPAMAKAAS